MDSNVTAILTLLLLIFYPKTSQASVPDDSDLARFSRTSWKQSINWTARWESVSDAVSQLCFHHTYTLYNDTAGSKAYVGLKASLATGPAQRVIRAVKLMNSTGRADFPNQTREGRVEQGNTSECRVAANSAQDTPPTFQAMYCTVSWVEKTQLHNSSNAHRQGICAPMSCSEKEVAVLVEKGLLGIKPEGSKWTPRDVDCVREGNDDEGVPIQWTIIQGLFVFSIGVLVLVGTAYEFIITVYYTKERKRSLTASKCGRFLMCFSLYSNTKKVFDTRQRPGELPALHGIRVLSCLWIIYGHVDMVAQFANRPRAEFEARRREWWFFVLDCFDMAVDTFLVLSAFLVTHWFLQQLKKRNGEYTWKDAGRHYLHRYWRLTPVYLYLLLLVLPSDKGCQTYWWTNLLYINNYFVGDGTTCLGVAWYLGVDMQMYIIAPALILLMYKKPKLGVAVNIFLVALSWVSYAGLRQLDVREEPEGFGSVYYWTPGRMGPYIMGMLLAYLLFRTNSKVSNTRATKIRMLLGWAIGIAIGLVATVMPTVLRATSQGFEIRGHIGWNAVDRSIFAAAVCWVIYACCVGYGGIISEFLSWKAWLPLSRLSYVTYLIHLMNIHVFFEQGNLVYGGLAWSVLFAGLSFWSFCSALMYSLAVEVPFSELGKMILPQRRGRQPDNGEATTPTVAGASEPETLLLQATPWGEQPSQKPEDDVAGTDRVENKV
ncbi:hypothetical protein Bbelb_264360 [Branchiostoma belcheri]|nr:hypothetical protein Bbelb_264360 [Branchiostoma belcheri]